MEPFQVAILTLAALLTGALLPMIFQARTTLRAAQRVLDSADPKIAATLGEVTAASREFREVTKELAATLDQVRGTVQTVTAIGSAVGPAIAAAVHAFKTIRAEEARREREASGETDHVPGGGAAS